MTNPMQSDPDRRRVALDHGEVVELDGGTLVLDGAESPSVGLRLAPWRVLCQAAAGEGLPLADPSGPLAKIQAASAGRRSGWLGL